MSQRYEASHGGGWVAKTSKKSVTYFKIHPKQNVHLCTGNAATRNTNFR